MSFLNISNVCASSNSILQNTNLSKKSINKYSDPSIDDLVVNLKKGDIVTRNVDADRFPLFKDFKHPLMYTGENITNDTGVVIKYAFIEANGGGNVEYWNYTKEKLVESIHKTIFRVVNANDIQIDNAVKFLKSQLGKKFQTIIEEMVKENDPTKNDSWYCTEIIWAAYYNCDYDPADGIYGHGIDIDCNKGLNVWPWDIFNSKETREFPLFIEPVENKVVKSKFIFENIIFKFLTNFKNILDF